MSEKSYTLNKIEGFNPYEELTELYDSLGDPSISLLTGQIRKHLRVDAKKTWFRMIYPDGATTLEIIENNDISVVVKACVYKTTDINQLPLGMGFSSQDKVGDRTYPPLESAATIALGNALEDAGFGCEIMQELFKEEIEMRNCANEDINNVFNGPEEIEEKHEALNEPVEIKPVCSADNDISEDIFASMGIESPQEIVDDNADACENNIAEETEEPCEDTAAPETNSSDNTETKAELIKEKEAVDNALSYVIKEKDNIIGSTLFEPYIGKALKDIDYKTLKLMREKLTTVMSEELIANIDQLL